MRLRSNDLGSDKTDTPYSLVHPNDPTSDQLATINYKNQF